MRYFIIIAVCLNLLWSCQSWFGESRESLFNTNQAEEKDAEEGGRCGGILDTKCKSGLFCKVEGGSSGDVGVCVPKMPFCSEPGGRNEGWIIDGELKWDACSTKAVGCGGIGTRSEGWYAVEVREPKLIVAATCSKDLSMMPRCVDIGKKSEGWKTPTGGVRIDRCSDKIAVCYGIGTKDEGWYAQSKIDPVLLKPDRCF